ncbi:DUF2378 family protein [Myxococcus llanfairpwllgwyngyllgogerychwyrndrobwllllantysiliogogogochensis]|uniref:DUF2378 family protein n=1 Tax=Myxococcus llanfairpwllgwyngyllgogerychwyrndrobwllllantysiliogogogochensis TaxID=2590453 RepID=A0A540X3C3_9BACT|nr:DUF2378 family protein [Myxococcus llanfairpwllgwyngyllgogerychwyrndrobwllllantysiliogogogochensis]TQF15767.1 DUF2378 family protein [Myxococcus llanfairpwllgwyngyllgogerychwyrndrobwllllantysiliogogogochensis]
MERRGSKDAAVGARKAPYVPVQVPRRNFEGLFVHALKPSGAFAQSLRDIGYDTDTDASQEYYPLTVWRAALGVARRFACAGQPPEEANRALGHHYVEGFAQTLVGRIFATAAPLLGTERCLTRLPTYLKAGREDMKMVLEPVQEREWCVRVVDGDPLPDFVAGVVEGVLRRTRVRPRVDVLDRQPAGYALRVRWEDA